jgi:hypothetical protein
VSESATIIVPHADLYNSGIEREIALIREKEKRGTRSRYEEAMEDADEVLACYRRIKGLLERLKASAFHQDCHLILRVSQLNANVNTWTIVDEEATVSDECFDSFFAELAWRCRSVA